MSALAPEHDSLARIATAFAACQRLETRERFIPEETTPAFVEAVDLALWGGAGSALFDAAGSREAASAALSLAMTIRDAVEATGRIVVDAGKGWSRLSRWRAVRDDAAALRSGGGEAAILPILISASLWSRVEGRVESMPARRPVVEGFEELAEFVWWHRVQLDLPPPPPLPEMQSYDALARWSSTASHWARDALLRIEEMPASARTSDVSAIIANAARDIATESKLHCSFNKNLRTYDDPNMSAFGRFYFCLYEETRAVVIGREGVRSHIFPAHITPSKAYDYLR